jgi:hypothetical protein
VAMKGTLAYKDVNGNVWSIAEAYVSNYVEYVAKMPNWHTIRAAFLGEVIEIIDDVTTPEWVNETPSDPIQQEQLDLGAFPNE